MNERSKTSPPELPMPTTGRLAGIDFGTVRIGLAISDPSQQWATALETYQARNERLDKKFFCDLAKNENLVGWVIGLPLHCDGKESEKSKQVRVFASWLHESSKLPITFFDERFTTAEARRLLNETNLSAAKRKQKLDQLAAQLILSHYLDSPRREDSDHQNDNLGLD